MKTNHFVFNDTKIVKVWEWTDVNGVYIYRCMNLEIRTLPIIVTNIPIKLTPPIHISAVCHQRRTLTSFSTMVSTTALSFKI